MNTRLPRALLACLRWLLPLLPALLTPLRAQGTGTIAGVVVDAGGRFLEGAELAVTGTAIRGTSEREGVFRLSGVEPGNRTLSVAYPGMSPRSETVTVTAGGTATVRLVLSSDTVVLAAFRGSTSKEGMAHAIALQQAAFNQQPVAAGGQFVAPRHGHAGA